MLTGRYGEPKMGKNRKIYAGMYFEAAKCIHAGSTFNEKCNFRIKV
jgi:hypothetical protein